MHSTVILLLIVANGALADDPSICNDVRHHENFHLLPKDTECGPTFVAPRVMHGRDARPGEFPWMAQVIGFELEKSNSHPGSPFCGGSVINNKYIVTAAHCPLFNNILFVRLGALYTKNGNSWDDSSPPMDQNVMDFKVEEILTHKLFSILTNSNDIALVRVQGEIKFNEFIKPICLPTTCSLLTMNFTGDPLTAMGWGYLQNIPQTKSPSILQTVEVRGFPQGECLEIWRKKRISIVSSQLCTRGVHGEADCRGDSGGPLVYTVPDNLVRNVMVGVVSLGDDCDINHPSNVPNVFTRVASFTTWILDHIRE